MRVRNIVAAIVGGFAVVACAGPGAATSAASATASPAALGPASVLKVSGNHLVTDGGRTIRLIGVHKEGLDYQCVYPGAGYYDGPHDQASVDAMKRWNINTVRLSIDEDCWLNRHGVASGGAGYQAAVLNYVKLFRASGVFVVVDLHSTSDGRTQALGLPMPGPAAPQMWHAVALALKSTPGVVFDPYNEPFGVTWTCWRYGCNVPAGTLDGTAATAYRAYHSPGLQALVSAIRGTGAKQPILLGGLDFSRDDSGWAAHKPYDPLNQLIVGEHNYGPVGTPNGNDCEDDCRATLAGLAAKYPVTMSEIGQLGCTHEYVDDLMNWADAHGIGYLAFTWNAPDPDGWDCNGPALISDYDEPDSTPTGYGIGVRDHFLTLDTGA